MSKDHVFDSEEIRRLRKAGWSHPMLAARFGTSVQGIGQALREDRWFSDPTLMQRWKAKLPAMLAAVREAAGG
jgi:hypothetical protein